MCDESATRRVLVFQRQGATTGWDLWVADPDDLQSATVLVQTPADERNAQLSRDGKWFAYKSNASGRHRNLHAVAIGRGNTRTGFDRGRVAGPLACGWARVVLHRRRRHADGGRGNAWRRRGSAGTGGARAALRRTGRHRAGRGRRPVSSCREMASGFSSTSSAMTSGRRRSAGS